MGTRGAYGYRIHDVDKVTYNHWDSYPHGLGRRIFSYIAEYGDAEMRRAAEHIMLVSEEDKPTSDLQARYRKYANLNVSTGRLADWYCLLHSTQGDLHVYHRDVDHMIDAGGFLEDVLYCEWGYIIDLDTNRLEVFESTWGQEMVEVPENTDRYGGVQLKAAYPLAKVRTDPDRILEELLALECRP